jgi:hypothetical protein
MFSTSTLITRMRGEYESMPGLKLTREQACRMWAVDQITCSAALDTLITEGFLHRTGTGKFIALPRPAGTAARVEEMNLRTPVRCPHCQKLNMMERDPVMSNSTFRCVACRRVLSFSTLRA